MEPLIKNCAFLFALVLPLVGAAQLEGMDGAANFSGAERHMFRSFDNRYEGVRGYPTLLEDFVQGMAELKNGAIAWKVDLNLDIVTGELLLRTAETKKVLVVQTTHVKTFTLARDASSEQYFNIDGVGYCVKVHEGDIRLYLKHIKIIEKANYSGPYNNNGRRYDEFVPEDQYYLGVGDSPPQEFRPTRKSIEKVFPDKSEEIRRYFKDRKPDLKNPADLASLFGFIDGNKTVNQ